MPIPLPSATNPILYHERKVWVKGAGAGSGFPPSDLIVSAPINLLSNGASVLVTGAILAAPGVGFRYRIWHAAWGQLEIVAGPGTVRCGLQGPLGFVLEHIYTLPGMTKIEITGGFPLANNAACVAWVVPGFAAVGINLRAWVGYTLEAV
jgi:hypothetical protein